MVAIMVINTNNLTTVQDNSEYDNNQVDSAHKQQIEDTADQLINDNLQTFMELAK